MPAPTISIFDRRCRILWIQYAIVKPILQSGSLLTDKLTPSGPEPLSPEQRNFSRGLGLFDSVMLVVGAMIGSGIFIVPAEMSRARLGFSVLGPSFGHFSHSFQFEPRLCGARARN